MSIVSATSTCSQARSMALVLLGLPTPATFSKCRAAFGICDFICHEAGFAVCGYIRNVQLYCPYDLYCVCTGIFQCSSAAMFAILFLYSLSPLHVRLYSPSAATSVLFTTLCWVVGLYSLHSPYAAIFDICKGIPLTTPLRLRMRGTAYLSLLQKPQNWSGLPEPQNQQIYYAQELRRLCAGSRVILRVYNTIRMLNLYHLSASTMVPDVASTRVKFDANIEFIPSLGALRSPQCVQT